MNSERHPSGLWVLFTTELWERFAYYAMRAILVLYLVSETTKTQAPGLGWTEDEAYKLYGWYTGLVYLAPLFGGWIADKFIGQRFSVIIGAVMMACGEFCLASTELVRRATGGEVTLPVSATFFTGLALIILGNGFFKPCISVMVGQMYGPNEHARRDAAFTIFYMGINIGAFFSPLIAGTIGENYGFQYGFLVAGIGMLIGLASFTLIGQQHIRHLGKAPMKHNPDDVISEEEKEKYKKKVYEQQRPLVKQDYDRIWVIVIMTLFSVAFFLAFEQAGSSLNIFAKVRTERTVGSVIPVPVRDKIMIKNEYILDFEESIQTVEKKQKLLTQPTSDKEETKKTATEKNVEKDSAAKNVKMAPEVKVKELVEKANQLPAVDDIKIDDAKKKEYKAAYDKMKEEQKRSEDNAATGKTELYTFPATWYQSVNPLGIILFAPFFAMGWVALSRWGIEPSTPVKFALGLILVSIGYLVMIPGAMQAQEAGKALAYWLVGCYVMQTLGELCLSPVGLSMVTKLAPARYQSLLMGFWLLGSCVAQILGGYVAAVLGSNGGTKFFFGEKGGLADFFLILALIPFIIGIVALILSPKLKQMMHGVH